VLREVAYKRRATYIPEAYFEEEGTLKSVANIEVSYEKAEQRWPVGPCGGL
jgi:hypothetical protein